jgi:diguanylate cyclase (GGDEF)-like protein
MTSTMASAHHGGVRRFSREASTATGLIVAFIVLTATTQTRSASSYGIYYLAVASVMILGIAVAIGRVKTNNTDERPAWQLLAPSLAVSAAGYIDLGIRCLTKSATPLSPDQASVTLAGIGVLGIAIALFRLPGAGLKVTSKLTAIVDSLIFLTSLLIPAWLYLLGRGDLLKGTTFGRATFIVSPLLLVAGYLTVTLQMVNNWQRRNKTLPALLAVILLTFIASDSAASFAELHRWTSMPLYAFGGYLAFFLGVVLVERLAPVVTAAQVSTRSTRSALQFALPYALAIPSLAIGMIALTKTGRGHPSLIAMILFLLSAFVVRQVLVISENKRLQTTLAERDAQLLRSAFEDPLTGLGNRLVLDASVDASLRVAADEAAGVMMLDLDRFKIVNDTLGHPTGDQLLRIVAERLRSSVRPADTVVRIGGDEFAVVLGTVSDIVEVATIAQRLVDVIVQPISIGGNEVLVGTSIGISLCSERSRNRGELIREADIALYAAKRAGGNSFRFYESSLGDGFVGRLDIEAELAQALRSDQLFVTYQPVIDLRSGRPSGAESLIRWRHPERGVLDAAAFIDVAEESGLIVPIGRWALEESLRTAQSFRQRLHAGESFSIALNISARQLMSHDLTETFRSTMRASGIDPSAVQVELPESQLIASQELLGTILDLGVKLTMDNFGTGYSSLSYLRKLPIACLKIGRAFVARLGPGMSETLIVSAVLDLAHALGLTVIAEGIETVDQLEQLRTLGCDYGQGRLWSPPLDADAFESWWTTAWVGSAESRLG